jgi:hypothetical protein
VPSRSPTCSSPARRSRCRDPRCRRRESAGDGVHRRPARRGASTGLLSERPGRWSPSGRRRESLGGGIPPSARGRHAVLGR